MKKQTRRFSMIILLVLTFLIGSVVHAATIPAPVPGMPDPPPKLNQTSATLSVGQTLSLKVEGPTGETTWASSNTAVATVNTQGKVTAKKAGTAVISASREGMRLTCTVKVISATLNKTSAILVPKETLQLKLTGDTIASASSSNTSVCTVTASGTVTAKAKGTATVTIKGKSGTYSCKITVEKPVISKTSMKLQVGKSKKLSVSGTTRSAVWSSNNKTIASVTAAGKVTAKKAGTAKIQAKIGPFTCTCTVKVTTGESTSDDSTFSLSASQYTAMISGSTIKIYFFLESSKSLNDVNLYKEGSTTAVAKLKDDGNYSTSGDDLNNDNIYSGIVTIPAKAGTYNYYAKADSKTSNTVSIKIFDSFSEKEQSDMKDVSSALSKVVAEPGFSSMSLPNRKYAVENVLSELLQEGKIKDGYKYQASTAIYEYEYTNGILGGVMLKDFSDTINGEFFVDETVDTFDSSELSEDTAEEMIDFEEAGPEPLIEEMTQMEESVSEDSEDDDLFTDAADESVLFESGEDEAMFADGESEREAKKDGLLQSLIEEDEILLNAQASEPIAECLILEGFESGWRDSFYVETVNNWNDAGLETTLDKDVTVTDFRTIPGYEMVVFSMHGSYLNSTPVLCTLEQATQNKIEAYSKELLNQEIAIVQLGNTNYFWIRPSFFSNNLTANALSNTIIFSESCCFMGEGAPVDYTMSNALIGRGVKSVTGFHNSVNAYYSRDFMKHYVDRLIKGDTSLKAFNAAVAKYGSDDGQNDGTNMTPAYPIRSGDPNAVLIEKSLRNGSFEEQLKYWKSSGDTRSINRLADITPTDGNRMAILTTGIGSAEDAYLAGKEGSVLSQTFVVPSNAKKLTFFYDVVSEEPMEYVDSMYDDKFYAKLVESNGNEHEIASATVNTATWIEISGINFEGGDDTVYHTTWKKASIDLTPYRNKTVTLRFLVYDVGDSIYDTAALIDHITIS